MITSYNKRSLIPIRIITNNETEVNFIWFISQTTYVNAEQFIFNTPLHKLHNISNVIISNQF